MDLAISIVVEPDALHRVLAAALPSSRIVVARDWLDVQREAHLGVVLYSSPSEFPTGLNLTYLGEDVASWLIGLARVLAAALDCIAIAQNDGENRNSYESIVWDRGTPLLADDSCTLLADGEGGPVRWVRKLEVLPGLDPAELDAWLVAARARQAPGRGPGSASESR